MKAQTPLFQILIPGIFLALLTPRAYPQACPSVSVEYRAGSSWHRKTGWQGFIQRHPSNFYLTRSYSADSHLRRVPGVGYLDIQGIKQTTTVDPLTYSVSSTPDPLGCNSLLPNSQPTTVTTRAEIEEAIAREGCVWQRTGFLNGTNWNYYPLDPVPFCYRDYWQNQILAPGYSWTTATVNDTDADNHRFQGQRSSASIGAFEEIGINETLGNLYSTAQFLLDLGDMAEAAVPLTWTTVKASAFLSMDMSEQACADGGTMFYRFRVPATDRDLVYLVEWDLLTVYPDGSTTIAHGQEEIAGNGAEALGAQHQEEVPGVSCTITVENVLVRVKPSNPGDGSDGDAGHLGSGGPDGGPGGSCLSCTGQTPGVSTGGGGPAFSFNLGFTAFGASAGALRLSAEMPSPELAKATALRFNSARSDVVIVPGPGGVGISQIRSAQGLATISTINAYNYEIHFHHAYQVSGPPGGPYTASQSPFTRWIIENPDASPTSFNKLRITESTLEGMSRIYHYEYTPNLAKWKLTFPDNRVERETITLTTPGGNSTREITTTIREPAKPLASRSRVKFQRFGWGEGKIEEATGATGSEELTQYTYSTVGFASHGSRFPLQQVIHPSGYWERYEYTPDGRHSKIVAQSGNRPPATTESLSRVTTLDYAPLSGSGDDGTLETETARTIIHKFYGQEIGRRYQLLLKAPGTSALGERREIECVQPGATWDASGNQVTTTRYYVAPDPNAGRVKSVQYPDGTMALHSYSESATERTLTVTLGQPNTEQTAIIDGTRTETILNVQGGRISRSVTDISSAILVSEETYSNHDAFGRPRSVTHLDGRSEQTEYACCGVDSVSDRDGVTTHFWYDPARRLHSTTRLGITTTNTLDGAGQVLKRQRIGTDASIKVLEANTYNLSGRRLTHVNAAGGTTTFAETLDGFGRKIRTTTYPDLGTRIERFNQDGTLERVTGTAAQPVRYEYGVEQDGSLWREYRKEIRLTAAGTDTPEWTQSYFDGLGRLVKTSFAKANSPYPTAQWFFNEKGQLEKEVDPDGVTILYKYDGKGLRTVTAVDVNRDGVTNITGSDRITRVLQDLTTYQETPVRRVRTYERETSGVSTETLVSTEYTATSGLKHWRVLPDQANPLFSEIAYLAGGLRTLTVTQPDGSRTVQTNAEGRLKTVQRKSSTGAQMERRDLDYDAHGRAWKATDARTGATIHTFDEADRIDSITTPVPSSGQTAQTTYIHYDAMDRLTSMDHPDNGTLVHEYHPNGLLKKSSGARTYPVEYTYDAQGRMTAMKTWQSYSGGSGTPATTTWNYDPYRGWLTGKRYADAKGPDYTYTDGGRLKTRTWARNNTQGTRILTTYKYGFDDGVAGNDFADVIETSYNDGTPTLTTTYDRRGRVKTQGAGVTTLTRAWSASSLLTNETYSGGVLNALNVAATYDTSRRRHTTLPRNGSTALGTTVTYNYDTAGRLLSASDGAYSATYAYLANSPSWETLTFRQNSTARATTTRQFDNVDRLISVSTAPSAAAPWPYTYRYNAANQRTQRIDPDGSYWDYQYDALGQVTSAKHYWMDGTPVAGQHFEYAFDDLGNRKTTKQGGTISGAGLRSSTYGTPNALNQHPQRSVPGAVDIMGLANASGTVSVNSQSTTRQGAYFHKELGIANGSGPAWTALSVSATAGTTTTTTGNLLTPAATQSFVHDSDGNLIQDGLWQYTWDAENRLIAIENLGTVPNAARRKLTWEYDPAGRRMRQITFSGWNGSSYGTQGELRFLYDGWACIAELNGSGTLLRQYVWGLDLSGTTTGAGGVGGLLWMRPSGGAAHFAAYDGNGNVAGLLNGSNGTHSARYEYDPFGNIIRMTGTGTIAKDNPFRLSTKRTDDNTDLVLYEYRPYSPSLGRWLSRDPIEESGGLNLYAFVENQPISDLDPLGTDSLGNQGQNDFSGLQFSCSLPPRQEPTSLDAPPRTLGNANAISMYWWFLTRQGTRNFGGYSDGIWENVFRNQIFTTYLTTDLEAQLQNRVRRRGCCGCEQLYLNGLDWTHTYAINAPPYIYENVGVIGTGHAGLPLGGFDLSVSNVRAAISCNGQTCAAIVNMRVWVRDRYEFRKWYDRIFSLYGLLGEPFDHFDQREYDHVFLFPCHSK